VSHAGAGSILDALRWGKKLVVVENTALMAGHQRELIEELQGQGYLLEGRVEELGKVVEKVVEKVMVVERVKGMGTGGKGIVGVLEEEMGIMKEG